MHLLNFKSWDLWPHEGRARLACLPGQVDSFRRCTTLGEIHFHVSQSTKPSYYVCIIHCISPPTSLNLATVILLFVKQRVYKRLSFLLPDEAFKKIRASDLKIWLLLFTQPAFVRRKHRPWLMWHLQPSPTPFMFHSVEHANWQLQLPQTLISTQTFSPTTFWPKFHWSTSQCF